MMRWFRLTLPLLLIALSEHANSAMRAWLDDPEVAAGETVQLTLEHNGPTSGAPDLTPLRRDFDIAGTSRGSSVQISNGKFSSTTQVAVTLVPKHAGRLTIPSLTWDSDRSQPLTVNVTSNGGNTGGNGNAAAAASKRVFLETEVDTKSPYVQAAVHVSVRVFRAVPMAHADLEFPDTDAALVRQAGSDTVNNVEKDGQSYQVVTRQYLLFPQHSGHLSVAGPTLSGEIPDRTRAPSDPFSGMLANSPFSAMFGSTQPIRLHADPIELEVQPRPAGASATYWLPARNVSLQAQWSPSQLQAQVGDPITLDLKLQAEGLTAAQLPDLTTLLAPPPGLKAYPDAPKLKDVPQGADLIGSREQSIAFIADEPGQFMIPELHLSWWDTQTNQTRDVVVPAHTITMLPARGSGGALPAATQNPRSIALAPDSAPATAVSPPNPGASASKALGSDRWKWISAALTLLWLGTLVAWLSTRRPKGSGPRDNAVPDAAGSVADRETRAGPLRSAFLVACRNNDAPGARRNLLLWANAVWTGPRIRGLNALAKLIPEAEIAQHLQALDRACYASEQWDGTALAGALSTLPWPRRSTASSKSELAPLYP